MNFKLVRAVVAAGLLTLAATGQAQSWTVQTVALQNYGEALAVSDQLKALDYDAYVDFGLYEGQQFVRVRVGCFEDQASAAFLASRLVGNVTAEAVAVPLEASPPTAACVRRVVGFETPASWDVLTTAAPGISFWVEVLGQRRFITFTGTAWRVAQTEEELAGLTASPTSDSPLNSSPSEPAFVQDASRVLCNVGGRSVTVTAGELLWQGGAWAVVLEGGAVTAYHVEGAD